MMALPVGNEVALDICKDRTTVIAGIEVSAVQISADILVFKPQAGRQYWIDMVSRSFSS